MIPSLSHFPNRLSEMKIYLVGGAVRDELLGIAVTERDWVVTGTSEQQMLDGGFTRIDPAFPVFKHPHSGEEYALARREVKHGSGYKGFVVETGPDITLQEDLQRRDLTINAIARDEQGNITDPFNGREDLQAGLLRHISPAFVEDPFRLIRIARFAAKLGQYGFHVKHDTFRLMKQMAAGDELQTIRSERIVSEMNKALHTEQPWQFFKLLGKSGALEQILPGFNQWINGTLMRHGEDSPSISALKQGCALTTDTDVRLAILVYRALLEGDYDLSDRLPLSKRFTRLSACIREHAATLLQSADAVALSDSLQACGASRQSQLLQQVLLVLTANNPQSQRLKRLPELISALQKVSARSLPDDGLQGAAIGRALQALKIQSIEKWLAYE